VRALALIDGEHYPPVVRDALRALPYEFVCCVLVGGSEKLRDEPKGDAIYGVPMVVSIDAGVAAFAPAIVVDLSDEPVLGPRERLALASRVLALGLPYAGADFRFDPPALEPFALPSLSVIGTGKRVGKTALAIQLARICARSYEVVMVAMGRGGPAEPELCEREPSVAELVELARSGRHAASDYLEDAAFAGTVTIGARRCGGGLAGAVAVSNVGEAAELALERKPELVIFEGSGASLPPVATDRRVLVISAHQDAELACGYLNAYRILVSDLVVISFAEPGPELDEIRRRIALLRPDLPVIATAMFPYPLSPVEGKTTALFTTAPEGALRQLGEHLERRHGARVVHVSGKLADRPALREELARVDAEVFLVELKAAAVEVVVEEALARGCEVVLAGGECVALTGEAELEPALSLLAERAIASREKVA
jgi:cyclic 2,3-diphosphoglycerate synthetase